MKKETYPSVTRHDLYRLLRSIGPILKGESPIDLERLRLDGGSREAIKKFLSSYGISLEDEEILTGHIDLVQIRNGMIHLLDYKPSAKKERPIDQLIIYALALSRLTSLRLFHFKCGWFDEEDYFEFFPLHIVYKLKKKKKQKQSK